jgi:hypothetical protein
MAGRLSVVNSIIGFRRQRTVSGVLGVIVGRAEI